MKRSLHGALLLLLLALLVSSGVATAATADGGLDASSSEAGAPGELVTGAGVSDASDDGPAELPPEYAPLKCDGSLCDTTTGETTCSLSEGRSAKGGAWPLVMVLMLGALGIGRRARNPLRRVS
jgi:hypothetical protein